MQVESRVSSKVSCTVRRGGNGHHCTERVRALPYNLTRDPELRNTPGGAVVASFGLAINRRYRQGEEWREEVCFVDIETWGRQAETVGEYLSKGSLAMVEGRLKWRTWETQDGQNRSKHEVVATNVQFMPRGSSGQSNGSDFDASYTTDDDLSDIPF